MPTPTLSASETNQMRCATDPPDLMLSGSSSSRTKPQRRYVARDSGGPQGGRGKAGQGFHGARRGSSRARRESSPAYRGGPMAASATATSTPGKRPSCASTNGMREYTSSSALNSANALTIPATASQRPSHGPTTRVARSGHAPSVHAVHGVSASTGITETRYTAVTSGSARASARGYVVVACSISPPIVDALSQPE